MNFQESFTGDNSEYRYMVRDLCTLAIAWPNFLSIGPGPRDDAR
jgi:hypothetical protein